MQSSVTELLLEAASLLLVGMVFVFSFLALLIGAIQAIAWFSQRFPDSQEHESLRNGQASKTMAEQAIPTETITAITSAIHQYRKTHK